MKDPPHTSPSLPEVSESVTISFEESVPPNLVDLPRLERLAAHVLHCENVRWTAVGIVLSTHLAVRRLNRTYLGHDYDTDVLSFEIDRTDEGLEGEVYVDVETAAERCSEFGSQRQEEIERYTIHGLLHLAGYNDDTDENKDRMRVLENRYLNANLTE